MRQERKTDAMVECMRLLFDLSPDVIGLASGDGCLCVLNAAWSRQLGFSHGDLEGMPYIDLIHPDDRSSALPPHGWTAPHMSELRVRRKDGTYVWMEWHTLPFPGRDEACVIGRDIESRKNTEERLRQLEERFEDLVENAEDAICTADIDGRFTSLNRAAERISGYSREEAIGRRFSDFVAPEYRETLRQMTELKLGGRASTVFDVELITKDGHRVPLELNTRLKFEDGRPVGIQGIARDIRVRKKLAEELQQRNQELETANMTILSLMNQDPLTKLANRRSIEETLDKSISLARRAGQPLSLVLCDLDRFKQINDNFGHAAGDEVLSAFGGLLGVSCRKEDTAGRYGGEEFIMLLPNTAMKDALEFAERVRYRTESLRVPSGVRITASFGVSEFKAEDTIDTLISRADSALYLAKERGRNRVESC